MALEAADISFCYRPDRPVLRAVSLGFRPGTLTAVVGPNGAGKSTLLRLLAGLLTPRHGRVTLDCAPVAAMDDRRRARRLAYVSQRSQLVFSFSVRQFVALGRYAAGGGGDDDARAVDAALAAVDLSDRAFEPFGTLSAGQQQRASLARALAQLDLPLGGADQRALILDEPISAQDPRHALQVMELLRAMAARGLTGVVALHDLALAARACDRAAVLSADGSVAGVGPVAEALTPSILGPVFGVRFHVAPALIPSLPAQP